MTWKPQNATKKRCAIEMRLVTIAMKQETIEGNDLEGVWLGAEECVGQPKVLLVCRRWTVFGGNLSGCHWCIFQSSVFYWMGEWAALWGALCAVEVVITSSLVLDTLNCKWLSLHHSWEMESWNRVIVIIHKVFVCRVIRKGHRTQPCGAPVLMMVVDVAIRGLFLWNLCNTANKLDQK